MLACPMQNPIPAGNARDAQLEILALLSNRVDFSEPDTDGNTPLHLAVRAGMEPLIEEMDAPSSSSSDIARQLEVILSHKSAASLTAALQVYNRDGYTPLHTAVANGDAGVS